MRDPDDRTIWDALLKLADANREQAEANREQAVANRAISSAILFRTQRMTSKDCATAMEPDRVESCYFAHGDAKDVASIAGQIVKQASSLFQGNNTLVALVKGPTRRLRHQSPVAPSGRSG